MWSITLEAMPTGRFPARLHVLLARDARSAVVIRRGPARHVATIGWDRARDRFSVGQWMYGRIYERRCDLSPDGQHLIYFAMNGRWHSQAKGSWTALSRAPYLKALTLWAKGDCWLGGGLFLSKKDYWLNDGPPHTLLRDESRLKRSLAYPWHERYGGECPSVYYIRLQRNGWVMTPGDPTVFEKPASTHWTLRKLAYASAMHPVGTGCYYDQHQIINTRTGEVLDRPEWEWADVDGDRFVWAEQGSLFRGQLGPNGLKGVKALYDFNAMTFEKLVAPY